MNEIDSSSWSEIKSLDERLTREPDSYCFARLSEIYLKVGLVADALHTARQGVARHPGYLDGQRALAMACNASGLIEESRTILGKVTEAAPADIAAQALLARLHAEAGDSASAIRVYTTLLDFNPDDELSRAGLERLQQADAGEALQAVSAPEPGVSVEQFAEDADEDVYELSEDDIVYDEGETTGQDVVSAVAPQVEGVPSTEHHDPLTTLTLAELYEQQGFIAKALEIYRTILTDDPDNSQLQARIAALESRDSITHTTTGRPAAADHDDEQESPACVALEDVSTPSDSRLFAPLAHQEADNVVGTLENWLENIGRIKACR